MHPLRPLPALLLALALLAPRPGAAQGRPAARRTVVVPTATNAWSVERKRSEMTDQPTVILVTLAEDDVRGWVQRVRPSLFVRCLEGELDVYVNTDMGLAVENADDEHTVRYRVDDREAVTEKDWQTSTERETLFSPDPAALVDRLTGARRLLVEWTPFNAAPVRARFPIAGLAAHRAELAAACPGAIDAGAPSGAAPASPAAAPGSEAGPLGALAALLRADPAYEIVVGQVRIAGRRELVPTGECRFLLAEHREPTGGAPAQFDSTVVDLRDAEGPPTAKEIGRSGAWSATVHARAGATPWTTTRHNGRGPAQTIPASFAEMAFNGRAGATQAATRLADAAARCRR